MAKVKMRRDRVAEIAHGALASAGATLGELAAGEAGDSLGDDHPHALRDASGVIGKPRGSGRRSITARPRPVIRATELGSVSVLKKGWLVLLSDEHGDIAPDRRGLGLYLGDTRVLSTAVLRVEGRTPTLIRPDPGGAAAGIVQLTNPDLAADPTRAVDHLIALPRQSIGIRRERRLGPDTSYRERVVVSNFTGVPQRVPVRVVFDADAADIFEIRGSERRQRGHVSPIAVTQSTITFRYRGLDGRRLTTRVTLDPRPREIDVAKPEDPGAVAASWTLHLPPGGDRVIEFVVRAEWRDAPSRGAVAPARDDPSRPADETPRGASIETDDELVNLILERAIEDLRLLRGPGPDSGEQFVAAGIPWFNTLFGRDSLIAAYGALPFLPELARDALTVLARLQADTDDPASDAEPGKILHELRTGEMARTGELPFARYYGSVDATPLWLILLAEVMAWTGDGDFVDHLWPSAIRALDWISDAPRDAGGFITYETRAEHGLRNQGWKDSGDSIRDRHGALIDPPIALAEVQGYAVDARRRMAVLARARGDDALARALEGAAADLARRFDDRFWRAGLGRYAMALGPDGTVADALASNVGHCLWAGVVPPHRAAEIARSLTTPPLFSGWGVRTYAADQPGFNPLGYHTGSVWPHDSAIAAAGLKRYGFHEEAATVAWAVLDAARHAPGFRLPELFCGFGRDSIGVPVVHPVSCAPQAWAAASPLLLMTTMLGLVPHASARELEIVRPVLPSPLAKVVVRGLAIGDATVDLLFHRWRGTTSAEVIRRTGDLHVTVRL